MTSRRPARPSCGRRSRPHAERYARRLALGSFRCLLLMCRYDASPLRARGGTRHISVRNTGLISKSMRHPARKVLVGILVLFLLPLAVHAALYAGKDRPASFRDADWSSVGMLS